MKRSVLLTISVVLVIMSWGCSNEHKAKVKGQLEEGKGQTLYLNKLLVNGAEKLDSVKLKENGQFSFAVELEQPEFYQLALSDNRFINLLLKPGEKVAVRGSAKNLQNYHLEGSEGSAKIKELEGEFVHTRKHLTQIAKEFEEAQKTDDQNYVEQLQEEYMNVIEKQRDSSIHFVMRNLNSLASIMALYQKYDDGTFVLYKNRDLQYIKLVSDTLSKYYPNSEHVKALVADKDRLMNAYYRAEAQAKLNKMMQDHEVTVSNYPDIRLPNRNGDTLALSDMKDKYVLLNFWATWNENSVKQNTALKKLYDIYHSKGFDIYQVSLDSDQEAWKKAIDFYELNWKHVNDQRGRAALSARLYNVQKLPTSFLFYNDEIIMRDLSIAELENKLSAVYN
jgi:peroxiredoxin